MTATADEPLTVEVVSLRCAAPRLRRRGPCRPSAAPCREEDDLTGERTDETILLTCGRCGTRWDRDLRLECRLCGSSDIEGIPTSTLEEAGRAGVRTPSGIRLVFYCWGCRGTDVTATTPSPGPHPPPGASRDLRAFRR